MKTKNKYTINYYDYSLLDKRNKTQRTEEALINAIKAFADAKQSAANVCLSKRATYYEQCAQLYLREIIKLMNDWK